MNAARTWWAAGCTTNAPGSTALFALLALPAVLPSAMALPATAVSTAATATAIRTELAVDKRIGQSLGQWGNAGNADDNRLSRPEELESGKAASDATSRENQLGGGPLHVLRITQPEHLAQEQLDPAQARQAWEQGQQMEPRTGGRGRPADPQPIVVLWSGRSNLAGFPLSLADASVDPFPQQVGVATVAGVLLDHVDKHFAQRDGVSVSHSPADAEVGGAGDECPAAFHRSGTVSRSLLSVTAFTLATALEGQRVLVAVNQGAPIAMRAMAPGECWQACGAGLRAYRWRRGTPGLPLAAW